jgi:hypothetical protein
MHSRLCGFFYSVESTKIIQKFWEHKDKKGLILRRYVILGVNLITILIRVVPSILRKSDGVISEL